MTENTKHSGQQVHTKLEEICKADPELSIFAITAKVLQNGDLESSIFADGKTELLVEALAFEAASRLQAGDANLFKLLTRAVEQAGIRAADELTIAEVAGNG